MTTVKVESLDMMRADSVAAQRPTVSPPIPARERAGNGAVRVAQPPPKLDVLSHRAGLCRPDMWKGDDSQRSYTALNEPKGPEDIEFNITHPGSDIDVTASFHANVFPTDVLQPALDSVLAEPKDP